MDVSLSAAEFSPVAIDRLIPFMTVNMRQKLEKSPFTPTHAVVALFAGRVEIGEKGGCYAANAELLEKDCERLRAEYPDFNFSASGNAWPLPAVQAARLAGLGIIGVNGLLFAPRLEFSLTIGAVLTDMPLSDRIELAADEGYCRLCGICAEKCPTGAITYSGGVRRFEREKCLSHLRQKEDIPLEREGYYGCDICQDFCPMCAALPCGTAGRLL
jgi:ferredoxin